MKANDRIGTTHFLPIAIGTLFLVLFGFWFTYWRPLLTGSTFRFPIHLHGLLWFGWFALLVIQAWLIRLGKIQLHRFFGVAGTLYGVLLIAVSFVIATQTIARDLHLLRQTIESVPTIIPLTQILMFTAFFGIAIARRQHPETHKRLIVLAALVAVTPAVARVSIGVLGVPNVAFIFMVSNLLVVLVAYLDWAQNGRLHSVYLWGGVAILLVRIGRIPLAMSPAWLWVAKQLSGVLSAD